MDCSTFKNFIKKSLEAASQASKDRREALAARRFAFLSLESDK
jgi:hypothetical protein